MNIQEVKIGTKLEMELVNSLGDKIGRTHISQLLDIIDSENIIISAPIYGTRVLFFPAGANVRIIFLHEKYGLLSFTGEITSKDKKNGLLVLFIKIQGEFEKIQRRNYFRLECSLDALFRIPANPDDLNTEESNAPPDIYTKALVTNISGSGACLVTRGEAEEGSLLEVIIYLDDATKIRALCTVMRKQVIETTFSKRNQFGLYFNRISQKDQDVVIKYIYEKQKRLLKEKK